VTLFGLKNKFSRWFNYFKTIELLFHPVFSIPSSSSMPSGSNHQIDWIVNRNDVTDQICVYLHNTKESFSDSRDRSYKPGEFIYLQFSHAQQQSIGLPVAPFMLSTHPGTGSFNAAVTIDGLTMVNGTLPHRSSSSCSASALVYV
jgi:hypothetical protein